MFGEQRQVLQVFFAGVCRVELGQLPEHDAPRPDLLGGVLDARNGLPAAGEEQVLNSEKLLICCVFSFKPTENN